MNLSQQVFVDFLYSAQLSLTERLTTRSNGDRMLSCPLLNLKGAQYGPDLTLLHYQAGIYLQNMETETEQ